MARFGKIDGKKKKISKRLGKGRGLKKKPKAETNPRTQTTTAFRQTGLRRSQDVPAAVWDGEK